MPSDLSTDVLPPDEESVEGPLSDAVIRTAAALAATGSTKNAVQQRLKLSLYMVNKLYRHELFRSTVKEISDDAVAVAKNKTRHEISKMQVKAMNALEKNLDKHSLEAVKVFLRAIGMEQEKEDDGKGGSFQLILANQPQPKQAIVVKREGDE